MPSIITVLVELHDEKGVIEYRVGKQNKGKK